MDSNALNLNGFVVNFEIIIVEEGWINSCKLCYSGAKVVRIFNEILIKAYMNTVFPEQIKIPFNVRCIPPLFKRFHVLMRGCGILLLFPYVVFK